MVANDDAYPLGNRGILETIASKLAPTVFSVYYPNQSIQRPIASGKPGETGLQLEHTVGQERWL